MRRFSLLLLCLLLLCGCAAREETVSAPPATGITTTPTLPSGLYEPGSALERLSGGVLRAYPLDAADVLGIAPLRDGVLVFSGSGKTTISRYTGDTLIPDGSIALEFPLEPENASLSVSDKGICYYDPAAGQIVLLDTALREFRRIGLPEAIAGNAILSSDWTRVFYCTGTALRCLETDTGISRVLKEMSYPVQSVTGVLLEDTVAQLSITEADGSARTLYISTQTGQLLGDYPGALTLAGIRDRYYGQLPGETYSTVLFGGASQETQVLIPDEHSFRCWFLKEENAAVTLSPEEEGFLLNRYDLATGLRVASLVFPGDESPRSICAFDDLVWILASDQASGRNTLYRWDSSESPVTDTRDYTRNHYTRQEPDYDGLALCTLTAQQLSAKYGIDILVYKEAAQVQPWDYDLIPEYRVSILQQELELLDQRLGNYPEGFLQTLSSRFSGLKICLVQELRGSAESGSLDVADGIQFWEEHTAYLALSTSYDTEYTLYHELCHLIDTIVLNESIAYDQWDKLNPVGFEYDNDYIENQSRDGSQFLQNSNRWFIDTYSMSYAKEDRARIMEYAMTEGNEDYFRSLAMQSKLLTLCQGIREAFGLEKSPETFLWEQYLNTSLAYTE